jgi:hypothetical protein
MEGMLFPMFEDQVGRDLLQQLQEANISGCLKSPLCGRVGRQPAGCQEPWSVALVSTNTVLGLGTVQFLLWASVFSSVQ